MSKEAFQQWDMFTGQPVTVYGRTDEQSLRQMNLFSVNEIVQFGVSARPWLKDTPAPTLTLECQDVRTEEEKERDRMREAEKQTTPLFPDVPPPTIVSKSTADPLQLSGTEVPEPQNLLLNQTENQIATDETAELEDDEDEQDTDTLPDVRPSKYAAYLALVHAAEERAATLYNTPASELSETITLSQAKLDAQLAGLTGAEIIAALTIGECRGNAKSQPEQTAESESTEAPATDADTPIAVAWVSKSALMTCRPDLTGRIQELNAADMALIAKYIRETLDKTYQMMVDMALIAYLGLGDPDDA